MPKTITFKKGQKETGLARIANPYSTTYIKVDKKTIGHIQPPSWQSDNPKWTTIIAIKCLPTPDSPCDWKWVKFKENFETEETARKYIKEKSNIILSWDLHQFNE